MKKSNIPCHRAIVILYQGTELSAIGEKLIADYMFDNTHASNITVHRLDDTDITNAVTAMSQKVRLKSVPNAVKVEIEKAPIQHALTYVGETIDITSGIPTFCIQLMRAMQNEEASADKKLTKALSIISTYDTPDTREQYPEYKKYGFTHAHLDIIRSIYNSFTR